MVHVKNYEIVSKFVTAMPRILWLLFSRHGVLCSAVVGCELTVYIISMMFHIECTATLFADESPFNKLSC